jgi:hypothetical protein
MVPILWGKAGEQKVNGDAPHASLALLDSHRRQGHARFNGKKA